MSADNKTAGNLRYTLWRVVVLLSIATLWGVLFRYQILQADRYVSLAAQNRLRMVRIPPIRGRIFDANGSLIASNVQTFNLMIYPLDLEDPDLAGRIAEFFAGKGIPLTEESIRERVKKQYSVPYRAVVLLPDITLAQMASFTSDPAFPAQVFPIPVSRRVYPSGPLVAHVLGYVGEVTSEELDTDKYSDYRGGDQVGKSGVEQYYEDILQGTPGEEAVEVDARGRRLGSIGYMRPTPGEDLHLTLDLGAQRLAAELMAGRRGAVFAMDVKNGDVKVLCSSPSFDANPLAWGVSPSEWSRLLSDPARPMMNRVISGTYPPGSTFKVVPAFAALAEGKITARTSWNCSGALRVGNRIFRCWNRTGHGSRNVITGLRDSCDVFFYQTGLRTGIDNLVKWGSHFGVGRATGIDLPGEVNGNIAGSEWKMLRIGEKWYPGDTANYAIGQGYLLLTPIQLAVIYAAIANGGYRVTPHFLEGAQRMENMSLPEKPLELVRKGITEVVRSGTGRRAGLYGVTVAGKTGTAQNPHGDDHAWFVGYAPADEPRFVAVALVEAGLHGSSTSGPIVGELLAYLCRFEARRKGEDVDEQGH